jgi:hypothetical protein
MVLAVVSACSAIESSEVDPERSDGIAKSAVAAEPRPPWLRSGLGSTVKFQVLYKHEVERALVPTFSVRSLKPSPHIRN